MFTFLDLPYELRASIYKHYFLNAHIVVCDSFICEIFEGHHLEESSGQSLAVILQTCKQVRIEAIKYYALRVYFITDQFAWKDGPLNIPVLPPGIANAVTELQIDYGKPREGLRWEWSFPSLPNLKEVIMLCYDADTELDVNGGVNDEEFFKNVQNGILDNNFIDLIWHELELVTYQPSFELLDQQTLVNRRLLIWIWIKIPAIYNLSRSDTGQMINMSLCVSFDPVQKHVEARHVKSIRRVHGKETLPAPGKCLTTGPCSMCRYHK